ncbi:efflux RND transporter permease subunit [Polycyclovorans algicola]|uniref:efflux RND transporter permease subunit n=1 Tax=Polycyclovorans algicola TaxID=616992 RepID=UPI001F2A9CA1|nr:MMPL family transporter [Polycyclovorans algicola]
MNKIGMRFALWLLDHRKASLTAFALITLAFAAGIPRVNIGTVFSDLLPSNDPFVQVFKDHPNFGSPLTMAVMIKRTDGDIYNPETLAKVWKFTRDIDLAPAVDHAQVLSISTEKARFSEATANGVDMRPLMDDHPPRTEAEMAEFRRRVNTSANTRTFLISEDGKATLIMATFIEQRLDYGESFEYVQALVEAARDDDHEVYLAGQPVLTGWVYRYQGEMFMVFGLTLLMLLLALIAYLRNGVGVLTPVITSTVAAVWAIGLVGWLGITIEPLLMVVPLLLIARSFSHSVQFSERYFEVYAELGDRPAAARRTLQLMARPSILSIVTDVLGIVVVIAAPIPAMVDHAIFCGMWAVWLIPAGVLLVPLLLASLPVPGNVDDLVNRSGHTPLHRALAFVLNGFAKCSAPGAMRVTAVVLAVWAAVAFYFAGQIKIGNPVQGTQLLWPDSEFNQAVRAINDHFPGTNTLEIVLEARDVEDPDWNAQKVETVMTMLELQRLMLESDFPPVATLSFANYLQEVSRLFSGGHPGWGPLDPRAGAVSAATMGALMGTSAASYSNIVSEDLQHATVSFWYPDNTQATVDAALKAAREAVETVGVEHDAFRVRLGTGTIALQQSMNEVIERYHPLVVGALNIFILLLFSFAYRSVVAGLILLVPVNLAHYTMVALMHGLGVGLDIHSTIIAAIGLGVGIDYGIYLLSRMCEEVGKRPDDWAAAIHESIHTTGKAIAFTASIMTIGILPVYLLSGLRFVADMGLLILCIMLINMIAALVVLPTLIALVRPRFVAAYATRRADPE